ncbi:hypothetical protein PHYBOEH_008672 [Phytophthora boehmeriae]|uniref:STAS domain-containing protein n=1 Tax=Phytophthora boehmeriae TaxID=109152 RepID=A0A8T1X061_9STRA|nr:hypothetical protein PHYBOEH_008672 [Phytophthora boehmeriae]
MSLRECVVVSLSFLAINFISLDVGVLVGVGIAILNFLLDHVQESIMSDRLRISIIVRDLAKCRILTRRHGANMCFEFCGKVFFGLSVQILESVQNAVYVRKFQQQQASSHLLDEWRQYSTFDVTSSGVDIAVECPDGSPALDVNAVPAVFVVMDVGRVSGMDLTAARSAFLILQKYCKSRGATVVFADALPDIRNPLLKNDVADEESFFVSTKAALEFCENKMLAYICSVYDIKT